MTGPITVAYTDDPPRAWLAVHGSPVCSLNDKIAKAVEVQIAPQTLRIVDAMGTLPVGVPADLAELRDAVDAASFHNDVSHLVALFNAARRFVYPEREA